MSKTSKSESRTVWLPRTNDSKKQYHGHPNCQYAPNNARAVALNKLNGRYTPCSECHDDAEPSQWSNNVNDYECSQCGTVRGIASKGVRRLHPCKDCQEVTSHERLNDE